jgi:lipoprotein-anchoring transpeptidase ErfK/SrfK
MSVQRITLATIILSTAGTFSAFAQSLPLNLEQASRPVAAPIAYNGFAAPLPSHGGTPNIFEALFGGLQPTAPQYQGYPQSPPYRSATMRQIPGAALEEARPERRQIDPKFLPQRVAYHGPEKPGTIVVDTPNRFLFLVQEDGQALRYGIGVGRPGFTWSGVKQISAKREWPDWTPPEEMLARRPDLPHFMAGGPENPLGARAMYLGSTLYRIHGSNEPWSIGTAVSSGCIRMRNQDVIDLYSRVKVGTKVVVI